MFKKMFPAMLVLALIAAYASFRAVDAQSRLSAGPKISSYTNLSTGDVAHQEAFVPVSGPAIKSYTNLSTGDLAYQQNDRVSIRTNLATGD